MTVLLVFCIIILIGLLVTVHELGHFIAARSLGVAVRHFAIGFGPSLWRREWRGTEWQINIIPLGGYNAFPDDEAEGAQPGDRAYLSNRAVWERTVIVAAGVAMNFVVGYLVFVLMFFSLGIPIEEVRLHGVLEKSPAMAAGLKPGDVILGVNGQSLHTQQEVRDFIRSHPGQPLRLEVDRNGSHLQVKVTPNAEGKIGVYFADALFFNVLRAHMRPISGVVEPFAYGGVYFHRTTVYMFYILGQLFTGKLPWQDVGGPIMAVHQGVKLAQVSLKNLFFYTAMLSIDLAIINLLPLPALDGGHLLLLVIEKVRGRRLSRRLEEGILQTGLMLLLGLGILLLFKDVLTIVGGHI